MAVDRWPPDEPQATNPSGAVGVRLIATVVSGGTADIAESTRPLVWEAPSAAVTVEEEGPDSDEESSDDDPLPMGRMNADGHLWSRDAAGQLRQPGSATEAERRRRLVERMLASATSGNIENEDLSEFYNETRWDLVPAGSEVGDVGEEVRSTTGLLSQPQAVLE